MTMYEFGGKRPTVGPDSWVHETAQLIGDVTVGAGCFIGPGAVLRGDFDAIRVGDRSSVQDNCVLHSRPMQSCVVGNDVTVGHAAVLHGCTIGDRSVIGMCAVVADATTIGADCIVAEGSLVRSRTEVPDGMLISGSPAEVKGPLKDQQRAYKDAGHAAYVELTRQYVAGCRKIEG